MPKIAVNCRKGSKKSGARKPNPSKKPTKRARPPRGAMREKSAHQSCADSNALARDQGGARQRTQPQERVRLSRRRWHQDHRSNAWFICNPHAKEGGGARNRAAGRHFGRFESGSHPGSADRAARNFAGREIAGPAGQRSRAATETLRIRLPARVGRSQGTHLIRAVQYAAM